MENNIIPKNIWEVDSLLNKPLNINDLRYVQTDKGRGNLNDRLLKILKNTFSNKYIALYGYRGCGKSTELKRFSEYFHKDDLFHVVHFDVTTEFIFDDILTRLTERLCTQFKIDDDCLTNKTTDAMTKIDIFNIVLTLAKDLLIKKGKTGKLLFIIDGTDKLRKDNGRDFFVNNADQFKLVNSNFIFCTPISLICELPQIFDQLSLPMIKLNEKGKTEPFHDGYEVMREIIYKRADLKFFDSKDTVDYIIKYSGGSPRELLKILHYTFLKADGDIFDIKAATKAVNALATEYRRFLNEDNYKLLYNIDNGDDPNDEDTRKLLNNLVLLEYDSNSYWRQSHPVIKLLGGYKKHAQKS